MKEKIKNINLTTVANIVKASLIGVVVSILLVLVFAFVLKFVDLSSNTISIVDQIIKIISIFVAITILNKINGESLLVKGFATGVIYSIITFVVFSILNGGINFSIAIFTDILFSSLVGGACAITINLINKK